MAQQFDVPPMTLPEIQADRAVREALLFPCQAMRPEGLRFPKTYIKEPVHLASCRTFASRMSAFAQTEVFKGVFKDIGLEDAAVVGVTRGAVVSEDRAILFMSIPRGGRPLPSEAPELRLFTSKEVKDYFYDVVLDQRTPFEKRVDASEGRHEVIYKTSSGVRDVVVDLTSLLLRDRTALGLASALAIVGFPAAFTIILEDFNVREGAHPDFNREGVLSSRGPFFGESFHVEAKVFGAADVSTSSSPVLEIGNRLVTLYPASRVNLDRYHWSLETIGYPLESARVHHRILLLASRVMQCIGGGALRGADGFVDTALAEELITWVHREGSPPARVPLAGVEDEQALARMWDPQAQVVAPSSEDTMKTAVNDLLLDLAASFTNEDLIKYSMVPLNGTDVDSWGHVWGALWPLLGNVDVNAKVSFPDVVSSDFTEEAVRNLAIEAIM